MMPVAPHFELLGRLRTDCAALLARICRIRSFQGRHWDDGRMAATPIYDRWRCLDSIWPTLVSEAERPLCVSSKR